MILFAMCEGEGEGDRDTISKRPGRRRAASIAFGRLVAANTIIPYIKNCRYFFSTKKGHI